MTFVDIQRERNSFEGTIRVTGASKIKHIYTMKSLILAQDER